jgi:carbon monoxide dehydrogenase subunit G
MVERQRTDWRHDVTVVRVGVDVDAEPEEAWSVVSDPRNLPQWDRHILAVDGVPPGGLAPGVHYVTVMGFVGMRARVACDVVEWRPPLRAVIRLSGLIDATVSTTLMRVADGRSRLVHEVDFRLRGGPLGAFAGRSLRLVGGPQLALRRGLLAQKRQIEDRARA